MSVLPPHGEENVDHPFPLGTETRQVSGEAEGTVGDGDDMPWDDGVMAAVGVGVAAGVTVGTDVAEIVGFGAPVGVGVGLAPVPLI